jgi:hypothetical protein
MQLPQVAVETARTDGLAPAFPVHSAKPTASPPMTLVVVGLDGGYVRSRHRQEERHFEVIAGKVIDLDGIQHRFAFARNGDD